MQQPTLQNVRVRSTRDALQIFYAVARGALPMIARRLDAEERRAIAPGNVYIWEERGRNAEATGVRRRRAALTTGLTVYIALSRSASSAGPTASAGARLVCAMYVLGPCPAPSCSALAHSPFSTGVFALPREGPSD